MKLRHFLPGFLAQDVFQLIRGERHPIPALAKLLGFDPVIPLFPDGRRIIDSTLDLAQAHDQTGGHILGFIVDGLLLAQMAQQFRAGAHQLVANLAWIVGIDDAAHRNLLSLVPFWLTTVKPYSAA
jgi:hypothetical protein